jgi:hypothetical protein
VKRWVAALVAVLFLSTATLHLFTHHGESDDGCSVCQVQASSLTSAPAPCVVVVRTIESVPAPKVVSGRIARRVATTPARAPPALLA